MTEPVLTDNALSVLGARYLIRDATGKAIETPSQLFRRVARAVAEPEPAASRLFYEDRFYEMMSRCEFMPNTPCLVNAGRPGGTGQLSACFVLPVPDSIEGIFEAVKQMALVHKTGGGTGFSFSRLRPAGDTVNTTSGVASGPVSFMQPFNSATETLKQGGVRRGANMGILRVDHPDILEFIRVKSDLRKMENFNLSVAVTDAFMSALANDERYDLVHPGTLAVVGSLRARDVWDEIAHHAWEHGDPGLFFIDRVNASDPLSDVLGPIEAPNPCVPSDTPILTRRGWQNVIDIVGVPTEVWNGETWSTVTPAQTGGRSRIVKVTISDGTQLRCTPAHSFHLADGTKVAACDLSPGDQLEQLAFTPVTEGWETLESAEHAYLCGFYQGDGYTNTEKRQAEINFYGAGKLKIAEQLEAGGFVRLQPHSELQNRRRGVLNVRVPAKGVVPINLIVSHAVEWLAGLIDADGNVVTNGTDSYGYQISSVDRAFLARVQLLIRRLGVPCALGLMKDAETKELPGGTYGCQPCWRITIAASATVRLQALGLKPRRVDNADTRPNGPARSAFRFPRVVSVEPDGEVEAVYCFTEPKRHRGVFSGVLTGQCGEVPLRPFDACTLGSINLSRMLTADGVVDLGRLHTTALLATRFLDNVLSINKYPVPDIARVTALSRKIGLGVMGLADVLVVKGLPYDSDAARELAEMLMETVATAVEQESYRLAEERGAFGAWEGSKLQLLGDAPTRNSTGTVIAPTGTISIIAGCSSSIEPLYALAMTRYQAGMRMTEVNPLVELVARREGFWSTELESLVKETGSVSAAPGVPDHWKHVLATANEISVQGHVLMQAVFQLHVDDAVSKTINMRNDATEDDVKLAYQLAWDHGCKGITVYRDGCRDQQVLVSGTGDKPTATAAAQVTESKRRRIPEDGRRTGLTISKESPYGTVHVTINEHPTDSQPFEVFARVGKGGSEVNAWAEAFGRLVSYLLSIPSALLPRQRLDEVARQLSGIGGGALGFGKDQVVSAPDAISRTLLDYLYGLVEQTAVPAPQTKPESVHMDMCPQCGRPTMFREVRCGTCTNCGYSKC